ncbi:MAG: PAS domain S-box protein [Gallionellaceae bacterium]
MKIGTRLLFGFVLVSVLPLALFSYFNLNQDEETLRAEALSRVSDQADKKVQQVKSYLAERVQNVRLLAQSSRIEEEILPLRKAYALRKGNAATYTRHDASLRAYLGRYVESNKIFYDVFLIDPQGEIVYSQKHEDDFATNLLSGIYHDSKFAKAFSSALMTLEPVISGYEVYAPSHAPALFIVAPIIVKGKLTGMFAAQLSNELFYRVARDETGLGVSGEATFGQMDGDGVLFTTPLKYQPDAAMNYRLNRQEFKLIPMFGALSGESGAGVIPDYRGKQVVAAWRYIPELDWGAVVKIDADEEFATIYAQRLVMLQALLGIFLFSSLLAYYFGRQISAALTELAHVFDVVAQGDLDMRANESAPGELGLLADAFNRMTVKLQTSYHTLEERIVERTEQLSLSNEQLQNEIVEREHIETALRDKQLESERNQDLLNEAQRLGKLGSWELNLVTGMLRWSDEIYRMFELDPTLFQPTYENFLNVIHPDDSDKVNQAYSQSLQDKQPYDVLHRLLFADGRIKWVREHCSSNFDESGKPLRSVGAVQDVTEQRLTEDNLRIAAVAFETHEAIMITDANANIVRVNQAFEDIAGYRSEEILGKNPRILNSGRQDKTFYADLWAQLLSSGTWSGEIWDKRKNGQIYPKWLTITAVKDSLGNATEYVAIFSDITARKQAEEEIRNLAFYDALTKIPNRRL